MSIKSFMLSNHFILCHPFLLLPAAFPRIRVFSIESDLHIRWLKFWASASAYALPVNIEGWFPLVLTGLIYLLGKGLWRIFSNTTVQKHHFFSAQPSLWSNSHTHTWLHLFLKSSASIRSILFLSFIVPIFAWNFEDVTESLCLSPPNSPLLDLLFWEINVLIV